MFLYFSYLFAAEISKPNSSVSSSILSIQPAIQQTAQFPNAQAEIDPQERIVGLNAELITTKVQNMQLKELLEETQHNLAQALMTIEAPKNTLEIAQADIDLTAFDRKDLKAALRSKIRIYKKQLKVSQSAQHPQITHQSQHAELSAQNQEMETSQLSALPVFQFSTLPIFQSYIKSCDQNAILKVLNHYKNNPEALKLLINTLKSNALYIPWSVDQAKILLGLCTNEEGLKLIKDLFDSPKKNNNIDLTKIKALMKEVDLLKTPLVLPALYYLYPHEKLIYVIERTFYDLCSCYPKEISASYDEAFTEALPILYLLKKSLSQLVRHNDKFISTYKKACGVSNEETKLEKQLWLTLVYKEFTKGHPVHGPRENDLVRMRILLYDHEVSLDGDSDITANNLFEIAQNKRGLLLTQDSFLKALFPSVAITQTP